MSITQRDWVSRLTNSSSRNRHRRTGPGDHGDSCPEWRRGCGRRRFGCGPGSEAEIEGEMGDAHMGLQARLMSRPCEN